MNKQGYENIVNLSLAVHGYMTNSDLATGDDWQTDVYQYVRMVNEHMADNQEFEELDQDELIEILEDFKQKGKVKKEIEKIGDALIVTYKRV